MRVYWNLFDCIVTLVAVCGCALQSVVVDFSYVIVLRFLDLLRPLPIIRNTYANIADTIGILLPRLASAAVVFINLYYFFAIVGIETYGNYDLRDCCQNTSVAASYQYSKNPQGGFYLNNFENIVSAGVTLFELTVVNNWYIIMDGYVWATNEWSRLFFMAFYICTMVVLTIVVTFILETFLFRIQCSRDYAEKRGHPENCRLEYPDTYEVQVQASAVAIQMLCTRGDIIFESELNTVMEMTRADQPTVYIGRRRKNRFDFNKQFFEAQLQKWNDQDELQVYASGTTMNPDNQDPLIRCSVGAGSSGNPDPTRFVVNAVPTKSVIPRRSGAPDKGDVYD
jgi:two pore calcium channel protein 1